MKTTIKSVCIGNDLWLSVGGNTPWEHIGGYIERFEPLSLDENGIIIYFDSGETLEIYTSNYMILSSSK